MDISEKEFLLYFLLVTYIEDIQEWQRPCYIKLSSKETRRHFCIACGLTWAEIERALDKLTRTHYIFLKPGSGRGKRSSITFIVPPDRILSQYLPAYRNKLDPADVKKIEELLTSIRTENKSSIPLVWWTLSPHDESSELLHAPLLDRGAAEQKPIGRENYLVRLSALLRQHHVVAVTGQPGVGKTRIIGWYQHQLCQQGGLSVYWTKVDHDSTFHELANDFLEHTQDVPNPDAEAERLSIINKDVSAKRMVFSVLTELRGGRYLLIIDNFEQLLDETGAAKDDGFQTFLTVLSDYSLNDSRVILVSRWLPRDPLGREPMPHHLDGFDLDESVRYMESLGIHLDQKTAMEVAHQLGGNPLAIQLSRTWLIGDEPILDISTAADAVKQAIDALTEKEKKVAGAIAILNDHALVPVVRHLVQEDGIDQQTVITIINSLSHVKRLITAPSADALLPLQMHLLVRVYVQGKVLDDDRKKILHNRAFQYWSNRADPSTPLKIEWIYTLKHGLAAGLYDAVAKVLFSPGIAIATALLSRGRLGELQAFCEALLKEDYGLLDETNETIVKRATERGIKEWLDEVYRLLGLSNWRLGRLEVAERYYRRLQLLHATDLTYDKNASYSKFARDVAAIAGIRLDRGFHKEGLSLAREALEHAQAKDDRVAEIEALNWMGYALDELGPPEQGIEAYKQAISLSKQEGTDAATSITEARLGMLYWKNKKIDEAGIHFKNALDLAVKVGEPYLLGLAQGDMGHYYMDKDDRSETDLDRAIECYTKANEIHEAVGVLRGKGYWLGQLGRAHFFKGQSRKGISFLKQAIAIHREVGDRKGVARNAGYIGMIYMTTGMKKAKVYAVAYYIASIEYFRRIEALVEAGFVEAEFKKAMNQLSDKEVELLKRLARPYTVDILTYFDGKSDSLP